MWIFKKQYSNDILNKRLPLTGLQILATVNFKQEKYYTKYLVLASRSNEEHRTFISNKTTTILIFTVYLFCQNIILAKGVIPNEQDKCRVKMIPIMNIPRLCYVINVNINNLIC